MAYSAVTQPCARPLAPARHPRGEGGLAEHLGQPELDEDAALALLQPAAGDRHGTELVGAAAVGAGHEPGAYAARPHAEPPGRSDRQHQPGDGHHHGSGEGRRGLLDGVLAGVPRRHVRDDQGADACRCGRLPPPHGRSGGGPPGAGRRRGRTPPRAAGRSRPRRSPRASAGAGVPRVRERPPGSLQPQGVRLDGVDDRGDGQAERADLGHGDEHLEGEDVVQAGGVRAVGARQLLARARRPDDPEPGEHAGGSVAPGHVVGAEIDDVVDVQVAHQHGVDRVEGGVALERRPARRCRGRGRRGSPRSSTR